MSLPRTELSIPAYYIIAPAEASSNLSRFDGVRYGHRAAKYADLLDMYKKTAREGFGAEVKRRIMIGTYVLHGYYDAYYLQAQKLRRMIADDFQALLRDMCDLIAGPVAPDVAFRLGAQERRSGGSLPGRHLHLPGHLAGLPGMSVPAGFRRRRHAGRLQLIGNYFRKARCCTRRTSSSRPPTGTRAPAGAGAAPFDPGCGEVVIGWRPTPSCPRNRRSSPALHRLRRRAQHPGLRGGPGLPGTLPVMNRGAVGCAIRFGLAVGARSRRCRSSPARTTSTRTCPRATRSASTRSRWCRAARSPFFVGDGAKTVRLTRAHLEEDAGKSLHEDLHGMRPAST